MKPGRAAEPPHSAGAWLKGFLLMGVLLGLVGPLMVAWQYHIDSPPALIGVHFLALNAGYVLTVGFCQHFVKRAPLRTVALAGCAVGALGLIALSFLVPPMPVVLRLLGVALIGVSAGTLTSALLYILESEFAGRAAAIVNYSGVLFGTGCLISTLVVGATYFAGSVQIETALLAVIPAGFFFLYIRNQYPVALLPAPVREEENRLRETLRDLRSIAAVLFSLLLFFQCGNEWAIAGWLPVYLIHKIGTNPVWAIGVLALYFVALMAGRMAGKRALNKWNHRRLLLAGTFAAMSGYVLLSVSANLIAASLSAVVIGIGFAPIYPLLAEVLDDRFSYHPGFYNGLFSVAMCGAMCAPWLLGYVDAALGIRFVMIIPAIGSVVVLVLALLMMLEARVMGGDHKQDLGSEALAMGSGKR